MSVIKRIRFSIRTFLGNHPSLFFPIYGLKSHNRDLFIKKDTSLVISAYPRTANTFFYVALTEVQNKELNIAHHLHVPALTLDGLKKNIPTVVLIRNPKDAIVSLLIREDHVSLSQALDAYLAFYAPVLKHNDDLLVADFHDIINNFPTIIERMNSKFGLELDNYSEANPMDKDAIFEKIDAINRSFNKDNLVENMVSRPSDSRKDQKEAILKELEGSRYQKKLSKCESLYEAIQK